VKCIECESERNIFDERLGEKVCLDCGLVLVKNIFENTIKGSDYDLTSREYKGAPNKSWDLGSTIHKSDVNRFGVTGRKLFFTQKFNNPLNESYLRMLKVSQMNLSYYNVDSVLKSRVSKYYNLLLKSQTFRSVPIDNRAASLTYFILREAGIAVTVQKHSEITKIPRNEISKYARVIASKLRKPWIFSQINIEGLIQEVGSKLYLPNPEYIGDVSKLSEHVHRKLDMHSIQFTTATLSACFYLVSIFRRENYTQHEIATLVGTTEVSLRKNMKKILSLYNIDKKLLNYITLNDFINGIRK
tara:strand:- start:799 stop:1701 length:903 start_codon:yes stop_codon:yes gene_type:complete